MRCLYHPLACKGKDKYLPSPFLLSKELGLTVDSAWTLPYTLACTAKSPPQELVVVVGVILHALTPSRCVRVFGGIAEAGTNTVYRPARATGWLGYSIIILWFLVWSTGHLAW